MLSFLFPPICPLCAKELLDKGEHICKICSKKQIFIKEPTCYSCGKSMKNQEKEYCSDCRRHPKNFERGMRLCIYQKPVTDSLAAIKYKNERKFAQYYLEEIRKRKYRELLRLKADAVIPVPIHKKKRRKRGFNQAEIFAKGIAEMLDQPMYTKIVERIHDTKPQKQLSPGERKNNLKKAFRGNLKEYQKAGRQKGPLKSRENKLQRLFQRNLKKFTSQEAVLKQIIGLFAAPRQLILIKANIL